MGSSSIRSSVETARDSLSDKIAYLTEFLGGEYERQGVYPAWEYRKDSPLRDKMVEVYEEMYGQKPNVVQSMQDLSVDFSIRRWKDLTVCLWDLI